MEAGALTSWDFHPKRDSAHEFVRNHVPYGDALNKMQFPPPHAMKPDS
jgi:hypothetical protein